MTLERMQLSADVLWLEAKLLADLERRVASGETPLTPPIEAQIAKMKRRIETGWAEREVK